MHLLRFAVRSLARSPGFTASTVLTLALGIGATTAIFSVLYAVLLRPFAYPDADQLVVLWQKGPQMEMSIAWPTVQDWMKDQKSFSALAAHRRDRFNISGPGQLAENVTGAYASASLFAVAQLKPILGRYYTTEEDRAGGEPVVVISESLWTRRYGRDQSLIGRTIPVDGVARTVVGIAPASLGLPRLAELWVPIFPYAATQPGWQTRGNNPGLYSFGRLNPGTTLPQAEADMERIYTGLRTLDPDNLEKVSAVLRPFRDNQVGDVRYGLWSLLAATALVLAIACANVASLFITRGISQERDYAIRSALGASRSHLLRRMLAESLLVAVAGGATGVLLSWWSLDLIRRLLPADATRFQQVELNGPVLTFSLVAAALSGLLAGLWPAFRVSRTDVRGALHDGARGTTAGSGVRRVLVGAQVALTLVLLSVSGLVLRSLGQMQSANLGFDPAATLTCSVSLPATRYGDVDHAATGLGTSSPSQRFFQQLVDEVRRLPGVQNAAVSTTPVLNTGWQSTFAVEGIHGPNDRGKPLAEMAIVSDDYFATLHVPVLRGRAFDATDATGPDGGKVVIVDEAFARKYWPGQDPIGKRVNWGVTEDESKNWFRVVGVVPTLRVYGYDEPTVRPQAYWSLRQFSWQQNTLLVRAQGSPRLLERPVRELLSRMDGDIAIFDTSTLEEQVAATYQNTTLQSLLLGAFAGLALILALTGLYGVVSYGVSMRRREIGVRMALGAQPSDVIALMVRQGLVPLAVGVVAGLAGALAAGQAIRSQLYEVSAADPVVLAATTFLLAVAATVACWMPARRAARVNPTDALRAE